MTCIFFDIETYSTGEFPEYNEKVIAIAYKTEYTEVSVLKEWEIGEKEVLRRFIDEVKENPRINLIGHNSLRFDIPVIVNRAVEHDLDSLCDLMGVLLDGYTIDILQGLLPTNRFRFKGLGLNDCARKIGFETKTCLGSEIRARYEERDHDAITEHVIEDVLKTERIYKHLEKWSKLS